MLSTVYAAVARRRRRYYAIHPHLRRVLSQPVISIGNLAVGGRAKTPLAALVAARLRDLGERPAILSRGYGRRAPPDGVVVVRDPGGIRADLDRAGDEPLMLARQLDGVAVLASASRYLAGRLAEHHFGCTVHVLDDGFQHFDLERDADILVVDRADLESPATLPAGRLREPIDAAAAADAIVMLDDGAPVEALAPGRPVWRACRRQGIARLADAAGTAVTPSAGPVVAVAGIADPSGFFRGLEAAGWTIVRELRYRDHHRYGAADVARIAGTARTSGARVILTTEKDLVRLLPFRPFGVPVASVPMTLEIDSPATLDEWLVQTCREARGRRAAEHAEHAEDGPRSTRNTGRGTRGIRGIRGIHYDE
jgi:tetraacyldisaccharide 4'-kinase